MYSLSDNVMSPKKSEIVPQKPRTLSRSRPAVRVAGPARLSAHKRGYTRSWSATAKRVLADVGRTEFPHGGPLCSCGAAAECVDHIRPHKGDQELFWDPANLQSLCDSCHSRKTATEDGGFGRPVTPRCQ